MVQAFRYGWIPSPGSFSVAIPRSFLGIQIPHVPLDFYVLKSQSAKDRILGLISCQSPGLSGDISNFLNSKVASLPCRLTKQSLIK